MPLHGKVGGKTVKEMAVENPSSRGGHTHTPAGLGKKSMCKVWLRGKKQSQHSMVLI